MIEDQNQFNQKNNHQRKRRVVNLRVKRRNQKKWVRAVKTFL